MAFALKGKVLEIVKEKVISACSSGYLTLHTMLYVMMLYVMMLYVMMLYVMMLYVMKQLTIAEYRGIGNEVNQHQLRGTMIPMTLRFQCFKSTL